MPFAPPVIILTKPSSCILQELSQGRCTLVVRMLPLARKQQRYSSVVRTRTSELVLTTDLKTN